MENDSFRRAAEGLERALQRLALEHPKKYQIMYRYMQGEKVASLARELGIHRQTGYARMMEAKRLLMKYLNLEEARTFNAKLDERFPKR